MAALGANFHVHFSSSLAIRVVVHHRGNFLAGYEFLLASTEFVFARGDLFPSFTREFGVFDCVSSCIAKKLTPRIEALFFPGCVDIVKERLCEAEIDLDGLRSIVPGRGFSVGHDILVLYVRISDKRFPSVRHTCVLLPPNYGRDDLEELCPGFFTSRSHACCTRSDELSIYSYRSS